MAFISWRQMAKRRGTSVSTEKRLHATDPRYPTKYHTSPGRVGFAENEVDEYDRLVMEGHFGPAVDYYGQGG